MSGLDHATSTLKNAKNEKGESLYDHMLTLFTQLIYDRPSDPQGIFEQLSLQVKSSHFRYQHPVSTHIKDNYEAIAKWISDCRLLLDKPKEENDEGQMVEIAAEPLPYIPDLLAEREMLRWAGIDLGEEETFRLQMSIKKLVRDKNAKDVRFWGKIHGTERDYYIVEGQGEAPEEEIERGEDFEKRGEGVNYYTYWVTYGNLQEWVELPDVTPQQISAAREIRKLFTGNLEADVVANPYFPGKEKDLLRVQIARITHATRLIPRGLYKQVEESPFEIEGEEEPKLPKFEDLSQLSNWLHFQPNILKANRITHMEPKIPDDIDIDIEILKAKIMEEDPQYPRLRSIDQDEALPGFRSAWILRQAGDEQQYNASIPSKGAAIYGYNVLRSLWWPGMVLVHHGSSWIHFYVGDGLKAATKRFYPEQPPVILEEPEDSQEQPEPTPLEAPAAVEPQNLAEED